MPGVLYISYDGLLEPLGQSQVWKYLSGLSANHQIVLLSYEKATDWANESEKARTKAAVSAKGVIWVPLRYHRKPSAVATAFDISMGIVVGCYLVLKHRIKIVHARSYVSSVIALSLKKLLGTKYIFDMRGFWADEKVDGKLWRKGGSLYRMTKWFERRFLLAADRVVSLTQAAVDEMRQFPYLQGRMPKFEVITTCADLDLFKPEETRQPTHDRPFNLGYVGSVTFSYLFDETLQCFKLLQQAIPDARLHILNRGEHDYIRERLGYHQIDPQAVRLEAMDHAGVARAMRQMDAGIFLIRQAYSKIASVPTKLGEFLGCGVPCMGNIGVGDMAAILERGRAGVALGDFSEAAMREGIVRLIRLSRMPGIGQRCRKVALEHFSLEMGVQRYDKIYCSLISEDKARVR